MNDTKTALKSVGVMGPVVGILVMLLNQYVLKGQIITDADTTTLVNEGSLLFGALAGIYGRWKATKQVTLTGKPSA